MRILSASTLQLRISAIAALIVVSTACAGSGGEATDPILVSAAASLTDAFHEMEGTFEQANPGFDVVMNFGGSSALGLQILEGAPADVYASADLANMDRITAAGEAADAPVAFATNSLQIAVPEGNPAGVTGLEDFANDDLLIGLCAEGVPCGEFARIALARAGVSPSIDTNEPDVRALLTKIEVGELDAGITFVTDVASRADSVRGIDIPEQVNVVAEYPIAPLANAANPRGAVLFVDFVLSERGQAILREYGFGAP